MLAHDDALLIVKVLLLTHEDLKPDPVLSVDSRQWSAEACDASLSLLDVVFEQVFVDHKVDHLLILFAVSQQDLESIHECLVDGADTARDHI